jgi:hypothetical protein
MTYTRYETRNGFRANGCHLAKPQNRMIRQGLGVMDMTPVTYTRYETRKWFRANGRHLGNRMIRQGLGVMDIAPVTYTREAGIYDFEGVKGHGGLVDFNKEVISVLLNIFG